MNSLRKALAFGIKSPTFEVDTIAHMPLQTLGAATIATPMRGRATREPSTVAIYALLVAKALDARGIDSAHVLKSAGLSIAPSIDPMSRIPVATLNRLFAAAVAATEDEYFGLKVAQFIDIAHMHALGHALSVSATLMELCIRLQRYMRLASHACAVDLVESKAEVRLTLVLLHEVQAEREDAFLAFLVQTMRRLHRLDFNPVRVDFHRAMPNAGGAPYEALFQAPVSFGAANPALTLPRREMYQPLVGASAELAGINDTISTRDLARLENDDVVAVVRQKIIDLLPNGECARDTVASSMRMSGPTLQLRLSRQGTSFNALLDATRRELAATYVQQANLPLSGITFLLGFSDASHFSRAFRRWEGQSPTAFRKTLKP